MYAPESPLASEVDAPTRLLLVVTDTPHKPISRLVTFCFAVQTDVSARDVIVVRPVSQYPVKHDHCRQTFYHRDYGSIWIASETLSVKLRVLVDRIRNHVLAVVLKPTFLPNSRVRCTILIVYERCERSSDIDGAELLTAAINADAHIIITNRVGILTAEDIIITVKYIYEFRWTS